MIAPAKLCPHPGCNAIVRDGSGRCSNHKRKPTTKPKDQFSSGRRWRRLRTERLAIDNYICQHCKANGRVEPAAEVHHAKPRRTHPELAYCIENLISLCKPCHSRETAREGRGKSLQADGR